MSEVKIGHKLVGPNQAVFIVAEIGINHNGSIELAKRLIDLAVDAGADAVKFQTRTVELVYSEAELAKPRIVPRVILQEAIAREVLPREAVWRLNKSNYEESTNGDLKRALEFTDDELKVIDAYCQAKKIMWFTSCWDCESVRRIESLFNLPCHKVASACNEDDELLLAMKKTNKPIILSTGMTDLRGIVEAVSTIGDTDNLIILHCTSVYPKGTEAGTEILKLINLRGLDTLRETFHVPIGFSSHDSGIMPTYAAVARGASMIEKHITLERGMWGSDQGSSIEPIGFSSLCRMVRELAIALGDGKISVYPGEQEVAEKLRRVRRQR